MRFYIASSLKNIDNVRWVAGQLRTRGHVQTYDWTTKLNVDSISALRDIGEREKNAVLSSDVVIIMVPAGKGSHVEFGIALGTDKRIILYSPTNDINDLELTTTFYHLPEVEKCIGILSDLVGFVQ